MEVHGWTEGTGTITGTVVNGHPDPVTGTTNLTVTAGSCQTLTISSDHLEWIYVTDANTSLLTGFPYTTTITAELRDSCGNHVQNGTEVTFTTDLGNLSPANPITTVNGWVTATLTSERWWTGEPTQATQPTQTAYITVTGTGCLVTDTTSVDFVRHVYTLTVTPDPAEMRVGGYTSTLTADVYDGFGGSTPDGVMVGFTITDTAKATVPYEYVEAEGTKVTAIGWPSATAGGVTYIYTDTVGAWASWNFTGTAVSFIYHQGPNRGTVTVTIDSPAYTTVVDMSGADDWVERVITTGLSLASRNVTVTVETTGTDDTEIDAFRSGVTVSGGAGQATAIATSGSEAGVATIEAAAIGSTITNTGQITITAGDPVALTMTPPDINLTCCNTETLQFTVTDQYGNNVPDDTEVLFETSLGSLGSVAVTKFTADGVAIATLTSSDVAGVAMITATAGSEVATTVVTFTPDAPDVITLVADPTSLTVGEASTLTATVKDQYGNNVADDTEVLFETSLGSLGSLAVTKPTADGIAVSTLTSQLPGVAALTATADSKVATTTVEFEPGPPDTVTLVAQPTSLTVGETSILTAIVKDQYDNNVADGTMVNFETNLGSVGSTTIDKPTVNGIVTATLTSQVSGIAAVTATSDSKYDTASVTFNPGPPFTMTVEADPMSIPIGGFTSTITATIEDQYGNPVADGTEVIFVANLGDLDSGGVAKATLNDWVAITPLDEAAAQVEMLAQIVKSTVNGVATATLTSEQTIGTVNITVFAGLVTGATQVTFTVGAPHYISVEASPLTIEVGGNTSTITAMVRDIGGYPVEDGTPVVFTTDFASLGSSTVTKYTTDGVAVATLTSGLTPGVAHITATSNSKFGTTIVKVAAGLPFIIDVTADPIYLPIGGAISQITATVKDQYGNNVANETNVDFITTLGSVWPSSDATNEGIAVTTLTSGIIKGPATVTAISDSAEGWVNVVFTVGPPFYINVVAYPTSIGLDGQTSNIQATVKDIGGNYVADGTEVTFVTSLGALGSDTVVKTTTGGVAAAVLTSETTAGTAVITATAGSRSHTTSVVFNPGPPHTVSLVADPWLICVGGASKSTLRATVTDQYGNNVADGATVEFSTTEGSISPSSDTTINGVAETELTSSEDAVSAIVTASCQGKYGYTTVVFYLCDFKLYLPMIFREY